jgi:hypothetical protein
MTDPREPGWYPDPDAPTSLQRYHDGTGWTQDSRPTGYVTQPAGPEPVAAPTGDTTPVFGATPPPSGDPAGPKRRMTTAVVATSLAVAVVVLVGVLVLLGVL